MGAGNAWHYGKKDHPVCSGGGAPARQPGRYSPAEEGRVYGNPHEELKPEVRGRKSEVTMMKFCISDIRPQTSDIDIVRTFPVR
jgi:hypothetical protein